ncbi:MAG: hypothetical protein IPI73_14210 [Betaproteobacteria bacterium]|nr:hypothetical protein [Betaproteobacteria bacterium]
MAAGAAALSQATSSAAQHDERTPRIVAVAMCHRLAPNWMMDVAALDPSYGVPLFPRRCGAKSTTLLISGIRVSPSVINGNYFHFCLCIRANADDNARD